MSEQPNETRDGAETPRDTCTCYTCGYQWARGQSGSHSCSQYLRIALYEARDQLAAAKAEREWMPMSEAPNDGRSVLLLLLYGQSYHVRVAYWADEPEAWESEETGHVFTQEAIRGWQPLPPADAAMKPDQTQV
jgi:hypothetical protein